MTYHAHFLAIRWSPIIKKSFIQIGLEKV